MRRARRSGTRPFRCRKPHRGDRRRLRPPAAETVVRSGRPSVCRSGGLRGAEPAGVGESKEYGARKGPVFFGLFFIVSRRPVRNFVRRRARFFFRRPFRARNFSPRPYSEPSAGAAFGRENICLPVEISSLRYGPSALLPIDRGCSFAADASRRGPDPARLGVHAPFRRVLSTASALRMRHCARLEAIPIV